MIEIFLNINDFNISFNKYTNILKRLKNAI
jgi:hypothetical protein